MSRFKDFGTGTAKKENKPLVFRLYDEDFQAIAQIPGVVMLDMARDAGSEDSAVSAGVILDFFEKVLTKDSWTRFNVLAKDPERIVTLETLGEIVGWLMEEYSDRPESQPEA